MGDDVNAIGQSRYHIMKGCEASLRRLGTDHIDLYQMHGYDGRTDVMETLRALDDLVRSGRVRYVGCTEFSAWHLMKALGRSDACHLTRFAALQSYYSILARELEYEFVPLCIDQGVGILAWSPLAGGFLTGKYRPGQPDPPSTRRAAMGDPPARSMKLTGTRSSRHCRASGRSGACPRLRWRSTTYEASQVSPPSSSAHGTRSSSWTIWRRRAGRCPARRCAAWTRSANGRCRTPTGPAAVQSGADVLARGGRRPITSAAARATSRSPGRLIPGRRRFPGAR